MSEAVPEPMISVKGVVKHFGAKRVLDGVSFEVKKGEIYGLLGPNGAGKTTTIKIILGLLPPDLGEVRVMGMSPSEDPIGVRSVIGYVPEEIYLYDSLTVREFLEFVSSVRGLDYKEFSWVWTLVRSFELEKYYDYPIASLSQGTKQKVAIIAALVHKPPILIMDEPVKGLDARSVRILKEILRLHVERGGAVLFSTHIMDLAESICDRVGIIHKGRILAEGTIEELKAAAEESSSLEEAFLTLTKEREEISHVVEEIRRGLL